MIGDHFQEVSVAMQTLAATFIPKAYELGRRKAAMRLGADVPAWAERDNIAVELLLAENGQSIIDSTNKLRMLAAQGVDVTLLLERLAARSSLWAWVLSPSLAMGMANYVDIERKQIAKADPTIDRPEDIGIIWLTAEDDRVCPTCQDLAGRWFEAKEAYRLAHYVHPGCVLPGQYVEADGITLGMRSQYRGSALCMVGEMGERLAVTPNHPILTPHGWRAAQFLKPGDEVVRAVRGERVRGVYENIAKAPSRIEEIFSALRMVARILVKGADFNGDGKGINGQVDIVRPDRILRSRFHAALAQPVHHHALTRGDMQPEPLMGNRSPRTFGFGMDTPASGIMRGPRQSRPLRLRCAGHSNQHRLFSPPSFKSEVAEEPPNLIPTNPEMNRYRLNGIPALVTFDKVLRIDSFHYDGPVYDLETDASLYAASTIIVHNCRCPAHFDIGTPDDALVKEGVAYEPRRYLFQAYSPGPIVIKSRELVSL